MQTDIDTAIATARKEAPAGAEALFIASVLAEAPIPFEMALAAEGAMHNPALINPAAAMFAVAATLDPICSLDLATMDHATGTFLVSTAVRHRILHSLSPDEHATWRMRAVHALSLAVPDAETGMPVPAVLEPHVEACRMMVDEGFATPDVNRVLHQFGFSLHFNGRHDEAVSYLEAALAVDMQLKAENHPDIVADLEGLATVQREAGRHAEAVLHYEAACDLLEAEWTEDNQLLIPVLAGLALSRKEVGDTSGALAAASRAASLFEKHFGSLPVEPDGSVAACLAMMGR